MPRDFLMEHYLAHNSTFALFELVDLRTAR